MTQSRGYVVIVKHSSYYCKEILATGDYICLKLIQVCNQK